MRWHSLSAILLRKAVAVVAGCALIMAEATAHHPPLVHVCCAALACVTAHAVLAAAWLQNGFFRYGLPIPHIHKQPDGKYTYMNPMCSRNCVKCRSGDDGSTCRYLQVFGFCELRDERGRFGDRFSFYAWNVPSVLSVHWTWEWCFYLCWSSPKAKQDLDLTRRLGTHFQKQRSSYHTDLLGLNCVGEINGR